MERVHKSGLKLIDMLVCIIVIWRHLWKLDLHPKSSYSKNAWSLRVQLTFVTHNSQLHYKVKFLAHKHGLW
jgi:hypothetical protein